MMLTKTFAVVAYHHNQSVAIFAACFEIRNEAREGRICIGDFPVVQMIFVDLRIRRRRFALLPS